jgi:glycosyltransferase involved in cell wall biosynthesis
MTLGVSVVIPVHNEDRNIGPLWARLKPVLDRLDLSSEVVFVNDGSSDGTLATLIGLAAREAGVRVIDLSRNFGKEAALSCGLAHAQGQAVVALDGDLQHPPELLSEMIARWREGYEMVYAVRRSRTYQSRLDRWFTRGFYWLFARMAEVNLPADAGDFRLLDRKVVDALNALPERSRFMKGIFAWLGFKAVGIDFTVEDRPSGQSHFNPWRKVVFAADALTAFSKLPLRVWGALGAVISLIAFLYILFRLVRVVVHGVDVPGYETILAAVLFLGGMQLLSLGVIGDYVGRVFEEAKRRPLYIVRAQYGSKREEGTPPA